ncbi:MAG: Nif3-like dinuclear metal center hexameric protein [Desulfobulbaceae bacterium]|uniref:GTP cyclohydrolase 1 type 2 homolog n=1 Tax=Candidatus Desulfobia pelagia TaxID=2841692 RepID=A0A8J6TD92_9BACT|nr:Nif3-like dinuclear metal center hexameric protein [Candidatus Desulfobia pelagia]
MAHSLKLKEFLAFLDSIAPLETAAEWDNVGLMMGDPLQHITGVLVALDPTLEVVEEAIDLRVNTIITHHPLFFHPLHSIRTDTPLGSLLKKALTHDISIISCHTNLDVAPGGVSDALAEALNLQDLAPITRSENESPRGFGRIGSLSSLMDGPIFLKHVAVQLDLPSIPVAGRLPESISRIAVCGGSGSELAEAAFQAGAQVYISGEIKHSTARWAEENKYCIIDAGHYATENVIVPKLVEIITAFFNREKSQVPVLASQKQRSPMSYFLKASPEKTLEN